MMSCNCSVLLIVIVKQLTPSIDQEHVRLVQLMPWAGGDFTKSSNRHNPYHVISIPVDTGVCLVNVEHLSGDFK